MPETMLVLPFRVYLQPLKRCGAYVPHTWVWRGLASGEVLENCAGTSLKTLNEVGYRG